MQDIVSILTSDTYGLFTCFMPGALFCVLQKYLFGYDLVKDDMSFFGIITCYLLGFIISRIGSLFVEPLLKKVNYLKFAQYKYYLEAQRKENDLKSLSQSNNSFRNYMTSCLLLSVWQIAEVILAIYTKTITKQMFMKLCAIFFLTFLFMKSYRKQTNYVRKRVENILKMEEGKSLQK